jgi:membrane protein YqaA with SNARE-associated domain
MDYFSIGFTGLFLITFLSATILPFSSELFLLLMLSKGFDPTTCLVVATIGNSLGGITNYGIGRLGKLKWLNKTGVSEEKLETYSISIQKYGSWLAFLSWIPIIGDPLVIALGYFRVPFIRVLILLIAGKFLRYLTITQFYF